MLLAAGLEVPARPVLEELTATSRDESFVRTSFTSLDELTRGVRGGELWVLTGRSGVGKTVLGTDLARLCAVVQRRRALYVSRRERAEEVARRLFCAEASVPLHHAQTDLMTEDVAPLSVCWHNASGAPSPDSSCSRMARRSASGNGRTSRPSAASTSKTAGCAGRAATARRKGPAARGGTGGGKFSSFLVAFQATTSP